MYDRIIVPLDGSDLAETALPYSEELAGTLGSEVTLIHVSETDEDKYDHLHQCYMEKVVEATRRGAERYQKKASTKKIKVSSAHLVGHTAEQIVNYADKEKNGLIVMATHGQSGVRRWALGSVADKVLRASKVPVWLVRAGIPEEVVHDEWPKRTMLVPLDGSKFAESVLPHVEALAKQQGVELMDIVLLRVCESPEILADYPEAIMELSWEEHMEKEKAWHRQVGERYLAGVEKRLIDAGLRVRSEVLLGRPIDEIIDYANKNPFHLIVLATHGRTGATRWAYGQVADKVLQRGTSPVFLVRPQ